MKRFMTLGAASAVGITALAMGAVTSPAHADYPCSATTSIFIKQADGLGYCEDGHNVTYGMPNVTVLYVISGSRTGWLSRRSDGSHVSFSAYQDLTFGNGINFNYIHLN